MRRGTMIPSGLILSAALCCAAGKDDGLTIRLPGSERTEEIRIESDSSNIRGEPLPEGRDTIPVPPDSFAAAVGREDSELLWVPAFQPESLTARRLYPPKRSFDLSVIVFAERTGAKNGPFGTRFILWDARNLRILRIFEVPFACSDYFPAGEGRILCVREPQEDLKDSREICLADAKGGILSRLPLSGEYDCVRPELTGRSVLALRGGRIVRIPLDGGAVRELPVAGTFRWFGLSPDGQWIAAVGGKTRTTLFSVTGEEKYTMEGDFSFLRFLPGDPPEMLFRRNGADGFRPTELYRTEKGKWKKLDAEIASGVSMLSVAALDAGGKYLYVSKLKNHAAKIDLETGEEAAETNLRSLKPETGGIAYAFFDSTEPDRFLVYDTVGGFFRIDTSRKRWKKDLVRKPWTE